jgi:hypothetical protein
LHPIVKILLGVVLVVGSVAALVKDEWGLRAALLTVIKGVVPAFLFFVGIFIVWLELDELRIERELAKEEKKPKKR